MSLDDVGLRIQENMKHFEPNRLNLGCGRNILEGWTNLDSMALPGVDVVADLDQCSTKPLPFAENYFDEFLLSHVIEHVRSPLPLMQELWRIAKPNATLVMRVPHGASDDAWEDPTHIRPYFAGSFGYFSQPAYWRADYGYRGDWQLGKLTFVMRKKDNEGLEPANMLTRANTVRNAVLELVAEMLCVKPLREPNRELQKAPRLQIQLVE